MIPARHIVVLFLPRLYLILLLTFRYSNGGIDLSILTKEECELTGLTYEPSALLSRFHSFLASNKKKLKEARGTNDLLLHHEVVLAFCSTINDKEHSVTKKRSKLKRRAAVCKWKDYYDLLDYLREPFVKLYDPGMESGLPFTKISGQTKHITSCKTVSGAPTAAELLKYVKMSTPVLFKGAVTDWPSMKWSLDEMKKLAGNHPVIVSATPNGDFDGPEDSQKWGLHGQDAVNEPLVIARPAHLQMSLAEYIDISRSDVQNTSLYLEYYPTALLGDEFMHGIPDLKFASFLRKRYQLIWMAASASRDVRANITGRLHFDRNENLMAVVAGKKTFHIFDPTMSELLYADSPLRSASYSAIRNPSGSISITRSSLSPNSVPVEANTYSPVDIRSPNYTLHPKYREAHARQIDCTVHAGDVLYLPSHWWHQVDSYGDQSEGKTIGINYFFEPFYHRPLYKASIPLLQSNRYYR